MTPCLAGARHGLHVDLQLNALSSCCRNVSLKLIESGSGGCVPAAALGDTSYVALGKQTRPESSPSWPLVQFRSFFILISVSELLAKNLVSV